MMRYVVLVILIFCLFSGVLITLNFNILSNPFFRQNEKLTVAWTDQPYLALMFIAAKKKMFEQEGLDITYKKFPTGRDALKYTLSGNADIATVGEAPVVRKSYEGKPVAIITTLYTSTENTAILARRDSGIATIDDLKGKKIAVPVGTTIEFFLFTFLTSHGIPLSDVVLVNTDEKDVLQKIKNKEVDAVAVQNPYFFQVKDSYPPNTFVVFQSDYYLNSSVLAGNQDVINKKKVAMIRLLRALVRAEEFIKTNKEESIQIVIEEMPEIPEKSIRGTWHDFTPEMKLNNVLLVLLERETQWFRENNIYHGEAPNPQNIIFADYLREVKPDAVTIY